MIGLSLLAYKEYELWGRCWEQKGPAKPFAAGPLEEIDWLGLVTGGPVEHGAKSSTTKMG